MPEWSPERGHEREKTCPQCGGSGQQRGRDGQAETCDRCNGTGMILS